MTVAYILLVCVSYFICGVYVAGRFGFSFSSREEEDQFGAFFCPFLWPLFLSYRFIIKCWERGFKRRFED